MKQLTVGSFFLSLRQALLFRLKEIFPLVTRKRSVVAAAAYV